MSSQTFRWDNLSFDGPSLPRLRAFDVPDPIRTREDRPGLVYFGYEVGAEAVAINLPGVTLGDATSATLGFNVTRFNAHKVDYRFNSGPWHAVMDPVGNDGGGIRTFAVPVDLAELRDGDNTLEFRALDGRAAALGNIDLSLR